MNDTRTDRLRFKDGPSYGVAFGYNFTPSLQWEFWWDRNNTSVSRHDRSSGTLTKLFSQSVDQYQFSGLYHFRSPNSTLRPYVVGGLGFTRLSPDGNFASATKFALNLGGGVKFLPVRHVGLRFDARWLPTAVRSDPALFCDQFGFCFTSQKPVYLHRFNFTSGIVFRF